MINILRFKCLDIEDKEIINKFVKNEKIESYEYLFSSLYMWRNLNRVKYAIYDNVLIIEKNEEGKGTFYAKPIGYTENNLTIIIDLLLKRNENFSDRDYLFGDVDEKFIEDIKKYTGFKVNIKEDINDFEYVYNTNNLIELRGKKYHGKKNHYNSFVKSYEYNVRKIDNEKTVNDCISLLHKWHNEILETDDREMCMEIDAMKDIFKKIEVLDLKTIAIYVRDNIAGFAVGERVDEKNAVIHAERGEIEYRGIYAFLNRKFIMDEFFQTEYINRQEDAGNEGLRKSKESYHPTKMIKKYLLNINI